MVKLVTDCATCIHNNVCVYKQDIDKINNFVNSGKSKMKFVDRKFSKKKIPLGTHNIINLNISCGSYGEC